MKQMNMCKMMLAGSIAGGVLMMAANSAVAQQMTNPTQAQQAAAAAAPPPSTKPTTSTSQMVLEACQRTKARFAKFLANGTPEQFGSEEPFTFDPKKACP